MKKTLLTLFTLCTVFQFTNAQEQARLSVAPLDSNVTCDKATLIPHTFNNNEFLVDSLITNFNINGTFRNYYTFIANSKSGKIKLKTDDDIYAIYLQESCTNYNSLAYTKSGIKDYFSLPFENLIVGNKYIINWYFGSEPLTKNNRIIVVADKKADNVASTPTTISGTPYYFNIEDYSRGSSIEYNNCKTSKADSNIINLFVKFKASSTSATLALNLDNASLESTLALRSAPTTCQPIQKNTNLRTDTFTGLTIGTDYTVRIEIGGDAALGYARKSSANNAAITLVGGAVTGLENNSQPTFSIAPNPSNGSFTFVSDNNADLVVYDLLGTKVAEFKSVSSDQNIDLQLAKGIYLLNVSTEKGSKVEKLVIE